MTIDRQAANCYPRIERGEKRYIATGGPTGSPGDKPAGSRKRCKRCGFHIRGEFHEDGDHHNKAVKPHKGKK